MTETGVFFVFRAKGRRGWWPWTPGRR